MTVNILKKKSWSYDYDHEKAKFMVFIDWVKISIIPQPGNFITAKELFEVYKKTTKNSALISEDKFYKEIEPVMYALNIKPGRAKGKTGRGFRGIAILPQNINE